MEKNIFECSMIRIIVSREIKYWGVCAMLKNIFIFICTLFISICSLFIPTSCYAFNEAIDGFQGIYWGDSIETVRESGAFSNVTEIECPNCDGYAFYEVKLSNPSIGKIQLDGSATLTFKDNKFESIMLYYDKNTSPISTYYMLVKKYKSIWGEAFETVDTTKTKRSLWMIGNVYVEVTSAVYESGRANSLEIGTLKYVD